MSKVQFRNIEESDLDEVFILLNQLKEIDFDSVEKQNAWDSFISNSSSNSIVGVFNKKIVAYGSIIIEK